MQFAFKKKFSHIKHVKMDQNEDREKGRRLYFKKLRKEQKKRRKERRKEEERKKSEERRRKKFDELVDSIRSRLAKGEEPEPDPGSLELFDADLEVRLGNHPQKTLPLPCEKASENSSSTVANVEEADAVPLACLHSATASSPTSEEDSNGIKEISQNSVVKLQKSLSSGAFGACYVANYRGMVVAVKELKVLGQSQQEIAQQRKEVIHEATIMLRLGDHRGLPLLFGIQSKVTPFRIIMQFHGINDKSLTIRRAVRKIKLSNEEWKTVVDLVGRVLQFIHSKGVLHNDLKGDNILLERREKHYNPVVIDFGKSMFIDERPERKMCMSTKEQKEYIKKYPHVAPEIVSGRSFYSIASDTYSFAKLIDFLCDKARLNLRSAKRVLAKHCALGANPAERPPINELIRDTVLGD